MNKVIIKNFQLFSAVFFHFHGNQREQREGERACMNLKSRDSCLPTAITDNSIKVQSIEMTHLPVFPFSIAKLICRYYILHGMQLPAIQTGLNSMMLTIIEIKTRACLTLFYFFIYLSMNNVNIM